MITFSEVLRRLENAKLVDDNAGATLVSDNRTLSVTNKIGTPFLSDAEAKFLLQNLTKTSREYIKLKKGEVEQDRIMSPSEYKLFRDSIIAEVCAIELQDPRIRIHHGLKPANEVS